MNNKLTKVEILYITVSVKAELPILKESQDANFYCNSTEGITITYFDKKANCFEWEDITHWLKEQNNRYILSEEEIIKLISDAFDAGREKGNHDGNYFDAPLNKEEYLKQILNS